MTFAGWVFLVAGIYGLLVLPPQYFLEKRVGRDDPPPITHPEYFYGFLGVAIAWQFGFLVIASDPERFRLMMLPAIVEKFGFAIAAGILFARGRTSAAVLAFGGIDFMLGVLFGIAFWLCGASR